MTRVEVTDVTAELAVTWRPWRADRRRPTPSRRDATPTSWCRATSCTAYAEAAGPACGLWAFEALRIARGEPRFGIDTDHRTIPNEAGWIPSRRPPRQGLLPRPGDRRPGAHPRPAAAPADPAAPRRLREPAARPAAPRSCCGEQGGRLRRLLGPPPRARPDRAGAGQAQRRRSTPRSRSTACPPPRRSWSTPRSACTSGPCARPLARPSGRSFPLAGARRLR